MGASRPKWLLRASRSEQHGKELTTPFRQLIQLMADIVSPSLQGLTKSASKWVEDKGQQHNRGLLVNPDLEKNASREVFDILEAPGHIGCERYVQWEWA
jgi:hypothetical protein